MCGDGAMGNCEDPGKTQIAIKNREKGEAKVKVSIWPREPEEKGGYAMMPMKKNIPVGKDDWKLTACPECGCECWETPLLSIAIKQGAVALCTECAIRK